MKEGYIYIVSNNVNGNKNINYIKEAIYSAKSLRKVDPEAKICLFTDKEIDNELDNNIFNEIKIVDMSLRCKQKYLKDSPYDRTIYLDSDTYVNHNVNDIFKILDKYEIVGCNDYSRKRVFEKIPEYMEIPYSFSEINGGIIAYRKSKVLLNFLDLWDIFYKKYEKVTIWDQPSLRIALWRSKVKLYILPNEYNRRSKRTKEKCIKLRENRDKRFDNDHLKTRIFHFHGLEKMNDDEKEINAQYF